MNYKVLITTTGIGSRLGELTNYTNKSLIRIGDKPAISHIIEKYADDASFVITLGHFGHHVREFLEMAYPNRAFEFVEVKNYSGPGSSLAYSIMQAKDKLQCPFVFNACDSILHNSYLIMDSVYQNFCIGSQVEDSSHYTTLLVEDEKVKQIKDKGEINYDAVYIGICGIKDYEMFWDELESLLAENQGNSSLFEGDIINRMLGDKKFFFVETADWFDIGNVGELEKTRKHFKSTAEVLEKKEESIYFFDKHVIKFFHNKEIANNRVLRGVQLKGIVPEIVDYKSNFYKYEKSQGNLMAKVVTQDSFQMLLDWSQQNLWLKKDVEDFNELCYKFYIDKTKSRIEKYVEKYDDSEQMINGLLVPTATELLAQVDHRWLCDGKPSQFHGDFILDNILQTKDGFRLLDWRQDFAGNIEVGDIYYDLAKLNHNLTVNHEIVNNKLFSHSEQNCYILCNSTLVSCKKILESFVLKNNLDFKKVETLTALIWINMAPLHEYPFNNFLFNFGKYNLKRSLND